jgi:hypothetical protein
VRGAFRPWKFRGSGAPEIKEDKGSVPHRFASSYISRQRRPEGVRANGTSTSRVLRPPASGWSSRIKDHWFQVMCVDDWVANWTNGLLAACRLESGLNSVSNLWIFLTTEFFQAWAQQSLDNERYLSIWCNQRRVSWMLNEIGCLSLASGAYVFLRKGVVREVEICSERWIYQH